MTTKELTCYLVVDWRDEDLKVRKTKPSKTSPYEIAVPLDLEIEVPDVDVQTLSAKLQVPQAHLHRIVQGEVHEEDLTEWQAVAEEQVVADQAALQRAWENGEEEKVRDRLLGIVMRESPGVPDPEAVSDYLELRIKELVEA